jgi:hypothetical protein
MSVSMRPIIPPSLANRSEVSPLSTPGTARKSAAASASTESVSGTPDSRTTGVGTYASNSMVVRTFSPVGVPASATNVASVCWT